MCIRDRFNIVNPEQSFMLMMAVAMFGAMFTWFMIFVTHLFFRVHWVRQGNKPLAFRMWGFPVLTLLGAALMLAALVSTLFTDVFRLTVLTGLPFLLLLAAIYAIWYRKPAGQTATAPQANTPTQAQAR